MLEDIKNIVESYSEEKFNGQVKIGIERSTVKSLTIIQTNCEGEKKDKEKFYAKIALSNHGNFFGSVVVHFKDGEIIYTAIQESIQGEEVKKTLSFLRSVKKCKSVKIAVKKSYI